MASISVSERGAPSTRRISYSESGKSFCSVHHLRSLASCFAISINASRLTERCPQGVGCGFAARSRPGISL